MISAHIQAESKNVHYNPENTRSDIVENSNKATIETQGESLLLETTDLLVSEWAEIFYRLPHSVQADRFKALLVKIRDFKLKNPHRAEPLVIEAITLCTLASADWGFSSLQRVNEAKALLDESLIINPKAMEGSAYLTLGNLYYRLPGWPISFGDNDKALEYYQLAITVNPDGLDSNYFMGDYWLREEEYDKALHYLEKAEKASVLPTQLSTEMLRRELKEALKAARNRDDERNDFFTKITPDFSN